MDPLKLCRACLSEHPTISIFNKLSNQNNTFADILMEFVSVKILANDGLPENICTQCETQIFSLIKFKQTCLESVDKLQKLVPVIHENGSSLIQSDDDDNIDYDSNSDDETYTVKPIRSLKKALKFTCNVCSKSYKFQKNLDRHKCIDSIIEQESTTNKERNETDYTVNTKRSLKKARLLKPLKFTCNICSNSYKFQKNLDRHKCIDSKEFISIKQESATNKRINDTDAIDGDLPNKDENILESLTVKTDDYVDQDDAKDHSEDSDFAAEYTCDTCNQSFKYKSLLIKHQQKHTKDRPFLCNICGKGYADKYGLKSHLSTHSDDRPYVCNFDCCGAQFRTQGAIRVHVRTHTGERPYQCSHCPKRFAQAANLQQHERTHTGEKPYECKVCNHRFNHSGKLKIHMRSHSGEKPYGCPYCEKCFAMKETLRKHIWTHTGQKPANYKPRPRADTSHIVPSHKCDLCNKMFKFAANLKAHLRRHNKEKPYLCSICGKSFAEKHGLTVHLNTHTGEKPFVCMICSARFTAPTALRVHLRRHTGEKPYKCDVCSKSFFQPSNLISHKRSHTGEKPYECNLCNKRFSASNKLKIHKRMHSGEKPYNCPHCDECFARRDVLTCHLRRHTGEKPYTCKICLQSYSHSGTLYTHTKTQHKMKGHDLSALEY
ncbi:unnamed protein product [Ceutorhynchus assimilis]|uniref:Protein krueppel n=1 Tax=Ceutorhynchus assimilis TaxID=467358 RepID=A0A9N9QQT7_9CUCU|nr:unnamed protein product [Ceutorhynchus assimilis]